MHPLHFWCLLSFSPFYYFIYSRLRGHGEYPKIPPGIFLLWTGLFKGTRIKRRLFWFIAIKYRSSHKKAIVAGRCVNPGPWKHCFIVSRSKFGWSWLKTMESCVFPNEVGKFHLKETYLTVLKFPRGKLDIFVFLRSHFKNTLENLRILVHFMWQTSWFPFAVCSIGQFGLKYSFTHKLPLLIQETMPCSYAGPWNSQTKARSNILDSR